MPSNMRGSGVGSGFRNPLITSADIPDGSITSIKLASDLQSADYIAGTSGWRISRLDGDAEFNDVIVRGTLIAGAGSDVSAGFVTSGTTPAAIVVSGSIESDNYSPGSAGWRIEGDGDAEFNDVTVRGTIHAQAGTITGVLSLSGSGRIRTATSGRRLEIGPTSGSQVGLIVYDAGGNQAGTIIESGSEFQINAVNRDLRLLATGGGDILLGNKVWAFDVINVGANGSPSNPAIQFLNDPDSGIYRDNSNVVAIAAGGSRVFRFSGSWIRSDVTYGLTTSNSANLVILSDGEFRRSTSSARYKTAIRPWDRRSSVLDLTPSLFRSKASGDDGRVRLGLIAEDVAERFPIAVVFDEEGRPDAIDWNMIVAGLISEVQTLRESVASLEGS